MPAPIELSLKQRKLFAAIYLDGELNGGPLEGLDFTTVVDKLSDFISQLSDNSLRNVYHLSPELVNKLVTSLQQIKTINNILMSAKVDDLDHCSEIIYSLFETEKDVFFPGGWVGHPEGHAMVYRLFQKNPDEVIFYAFNTGAGREFHHQVSSILPQAVENYREKFNPVYAIRFDASQIGLFGGLSAWVKQLITPLVTPNYDSRYSDNNVEGIYERIIPTSAYLGGEIVDPTPYYSHLTSGQRSGTCAQQVIQKCLRIFFSRDTPYKQFMLDYRIYVLDEHLQARNMPLSFKKLFNTSLENTARMLTTGKILEKLSSEEKVAYVSQLTKLREEANTYFSQTMPLTLLEKEEPINDIKPTVFSVSSRIVPVDVSASTDSPNNKRQTPLFLFNKNDTLVDAVKSLELECQQDDKRVFVQNIEALCFTFCEQVKDFANNEFSNESSLEEWIQTIRLLHRYSIEYFDFYCKSKSKVQDDNFNYWFNARTIRNRGYKDYPGSSRNQIIGMGLACLSHYAGMMHEAKILGYSHWQDDLNHFDDYLAYIPRILLFQFMSRNFLLSSTDPAISQLFLTLQSFYQKQKNKKIESNEALGIQLFEYYKSVLNHNAFQDEKTQLDAYFDDNIEQWRKGWDKNTEKVIVQNKMKTILAASGRLLTTLPRLETYFNTHHHLFGLLFFYARSIISNPDVGEGLFPLNMCREKREPHRFYIQTSLTGPYAPYNCYDEFAADGQWEHYVKLGVRCISGISSTSKITLNPEIMLSLQHDIIKPPLNSNQIRLAYQCTATQKDLHDLRVSPSLQAIQTIDYFIQHFDRLEIRDYQWFMLFSIFQPGILELSLTHQADIISAMARFYQKGIMSGDLVLETRSLSHRGFFVLKILSWVYGYIIATANASEAIKASTRLAYAQLDNQIQQWIEQQREPLMQAELQRLTFFNTMKQFSPIDLSLPENRNHLKRLIYARLYIQQYSERRIVDMITTAEDDSFEPLFFQLSSIDTRAVHDVLPEIMGELLPGQAPFVVPTESQAFLPTDYRCLDKNHQETSISLLTGILDLENQPLMTIPIQLARNAPGYQRIIGNLYPLAQRTQTEEYRFIWEEAHYCLNTKGFYKTINNEWYQYGAAEFLPEYLRKPCYYAWVNGAGDTAFIWQHRDEAEPLLAYTWQNGKLNAHLMKGWVCFDGDVRHHILSSLLPFEDSGLIEVIQLSLNESEYYFHLPRYALSGHFDAKIAAMTLEINQKSYYQTSYSSPFNTGLMVSEHRDATHQQCILLLPIQPFYTEKTIIAGHYLLLHDRQRVIDYKKEFRGQQYAQYHMNKKGDWKPTNNASEQLYLVYMYCAHYEYDKAYTLIQQYSFQGTLTELTYIHWLCHYLPGKKKDATALEDPILNTPLLTIKLTALIMMSHKSWSLASTVPQELRTFVEDSPHYIRKLYNQYHRRSNNLSTEEKIPHLSLEWLAHSVWLDLEKKKRKASELIQQLQQQIDLLKPDGYGSEALKKQLSDQAMIVVTCNNEQTSGALAFVHAMTRPFSSDSQNNVLFRSPVTTLYTKQNCTPSTDYYPPSKMIGSFEDLQYAQAHCQEYQLNDAVALLTQNMKKDIFFSQLKYYFILILGSQPEYAAYRAKLRLFCERTIIAYESMFQTDKLNPMKSNLMGDRIDFYKLASILWLGVENQALFNQAYTKVINQYINQPLELKSRDFWQVIRDRDYGFLKLINSKSVSIEYIKATHFSEKRTLPQLAERNPIKISSKLPRLSQAEPSLFFRLTQDLLALEKGYQHTRAQQILQYQALSLQGQRQHYHHTDEALDLAKALYLQGVKNLIRTNLNIEETKHQLKATLTQLAEELLAHQRTLHDAMKTLPESLETLLSLQLHQLGAKILPLQIEQLLIQYALGIEEPFLESRHLSPQAIINIRQTLEQWLKHVFFHRQYQRIFETLQSFGQSVDGYKQEALQEQLAQQISELAPFDEHPALHVFQYQTFKTVRTTQWALVKSLMQNPQENIGQLIMGGGKSKIVLPLLAFLKTDGKYLAVIEAPEALLQTTYNDLKPTLKVVFNQELELFTFGRHSASDPLSLMYYLRRFENMIQQKKCLMLAPSSLQSLHLKWREYLYQAQSDLSLADGSPLFQQIELLTQILLLFKNKADVVAEEIHKILDVNHELNYSIGQAAAIDSELIKDSLDLYDFFETVTIDVADDTALAFLNGKSFSEILQNPEWLTHPETLISQLLAFYEQCFYKAYPLEIQHQKAKIAAFRYAQWHIFLPLTLHQKFREHYGPSPLEGVHIAVPYAANNVPTTNFFANFIESLNYTIQMCHLDGINFVVFKQLLQSWKHADLSFYRNDDSIVSDTQIIYQNCLSTLDESHHLPACLRQIDMSNPALLQIIHTNLYKNKNFVRAALEDIILPSVRLYPLKLTSNAINHVSQVKRMQGVSGTPDNFPTYHNRLQLDVTTTFGTKSYLKTLLRNKNTEILLQGEENLAKLSAIIDIGAHRRGQTNLEVAQDIAKKIGHTDYRYILFFHHDLLCALPIHAPSEWITLSSSDPQHIKQCLNVMPTQCFSYYDQSHSTGIDLPQSPTACAAVSVDMTTTLSSFLQAISRMRLLSAEQTVKIFLSPILENKLGATPTLDDLYACLEGNEDDKLAQDVFKAACKKLANVIQVDLDNRIQACNTAKESVHLFKQFQDLLIDKNPDDVIALYGKPLQAQNTDTILNLLKEELLKKWLRVTASSEDESTLRRQCDTIISHALSYTKDKQLSAIELGTEVKVEQQQEVEVELKTELQMECIDASFSANTIDTQWARQFYLTAENSLPEAMTLAQVSSNLTLSIAWSSCLWASKQFYQIYSQQPQNHLPKEISLKPAFATLFWENGDRISACLICAEEAEVIANRLTSKDLKYSGFVWLESSLGIVLAGIQAIRDENFRAYKILKEQIYTLQGDIPTLASQKELFWLSTDHLSFLEQRMIQQNRPYKSILTQLNKRFFQVPELLQTAVVSTNHDLVAVRLRYFQPENTSHKVNNQALSPIMFNRGI